MVFERALKVAADISDSLEGDLALVGWGNCETGFHC